MAELSYKERLKRIEDTYNQFLVLKGKYNDVEKKIGNTQKEINNNNEKLDEIDKTLSSLADIKADMSKELLNEYNIENDEIIRWYKKEEKLIDDADAWEDKKAEDEIRSEYKEKILAEENKLQNARQSVINAEEEVSRTTTICKELEQRIAYSGQEENQIKLCISKVRESCENVEKNEGFLYDLRDPRGANARKAEDKFASFNDTKLVKIAEKMNRGVYVSSPDESRGLPILEIIFRVFSSLIAILKGVWAGLKLIYRPVRRFYKTSHKLIYVGVVTLALFFIVLWIISSFGEGISVILFLLVALLVIVFVGMVIFNIIKYSNKAYRKELNLEYYTVGYYFTYKREEILFRLAKIYYNDLKAKSPEQLQRLLDESFGHLNIEKEQVEQQLVLKKQYLESEEENFKSASIACDEECSRLQAKCDEEVEDRVSELRHARMLRREEIEEELKSRQEINEKRRAERENDLEEAAIAKADRRKQEIERIKSELSSLESELTKLRSEKQTIVSDIKNVVSDNKKSAETYKNGDVELIQKRTEGDKLEDSFLVGLRKQVEEVGGDTCSLYHSICIEHKKQPVMIVFDGAENEESNVITENYYDMMDSMLGKMLTETYYRAFKFVLIDSQGNRNSIVQNMKTCSKDFNTLEEYDIVKVITEPVGKAFDSIINEQEQVLSNKSVDEINNANKRTDVMAQYIIMSIRLYEKKASEFSVKDLKKNLQRCKSDGVIPILLMSRTYFDNNMEDLQLSIKEECNGSYYVLEVGNNNGIVTAITKKNIG